LCICTLALRALCSACALGAGCAGRKRCDNLGIAHLDICRAVSPVKHSGRYGRWPELIQLLPSRRLPLTINLRSSLDDICITSLQQLPYALGKPWDMGLRVYLIDGLYRKILCLARAIQPDPSVLATIIWQWQLSFIMLIIVPLFPMSLGTFVAPISMMRPPVNFLQSRFFMSSKTCLFFDTFATFATIRSPIS